MRQHEHLARKIGFELRFRIVLQQQARPKQIRIVAELPRNPTGKVQRFKLREILELELRRKD